MGSGGLLGASVRDELERANPTAEIWRLERSISWDDVDASDRQLRGEATRFLERASRGGMPWTLLWCAGAGSVTTSSEALARETALVERFLAFVGDALAEDAPLALAGSVFFASSAGGVYAACGATPPFDELSPVGALSPYGHAKLRQEELFRAFAKRCGVDLMIGRLSNLYGPGQKLSKAQGLISHIGSAALRRDLVTIYVPLDTIRDYLFADDAGRMVVDALALRAGMRRDVAPGRSVTKILASEVESTVASVLGTWRQSLRHPLRVALASSPAGQLQPRVLSFRSRVGPDVLGRPTSLALGIEAVRRDQLARFLATGAP